MLRRATFAAIAALAMPAFTLPAHSQPAPTGTLNIAMADDSDILDPTIARTYVSRIIFEGLCDKLFDIDENLNVVPQLALSYNYETPTSLVLHLRPGVLFQDGTKFDAAAVAYTLTRHLTMSGSTRRAEISSLDRTEIIDPLTIRLVLKAPSAPFISQLTDRAGMIVSPKAAAAEGANFGNHPVCTGPFSFAERVAQDHVTLDRFPGYWDAKDIHFARVTYRPIPDNTIRFNNLRAGTLDLGERLAATDIPAARQTGNLSVLVYPGLGYDSITFNVGNGAGANSDFARNALVRKAFELSIDRDTINKVVFNGLQIPVAQGMTPRNPLYNAALQPQPRDVAHARALLAKAGVQLPVPVTLTMVNTPEQLQVGEIMQSMANEAGFKVQVQASEFGSALAAETRGDFMATAIGWSGRVDPDGNITNAIYSSGPLNASHYGNKQVDEWLDQARLTTDIGARKALYAKITDQLATDMPVMYLYSRSIIMAMNKKLQGFRAVPDGLIRLQGLRMAK
jgi:peptide/nickel transport system substrate-binding protein